MRELEHRERRAAVLYQRALADLGLGLAHVEGVGPDLAGDDEQHRHRGGDEPPVEEERPGELLDDAYLLHGEGDVAVARRAAHGQQHEDERQLVAHDGDHGARDADAREGRARGRAAEDDSERGYGEQVEDDHRVRRAAECLKAAERDEERRHDEAHEADVRGREEGQPRRVRRDDGLLAQQLEEVIGRLQYGRADALLHPGEELPVHAREPEPEHGGEQKSGKNEDIDRFYQYFHLSSPPYMNAKQYRTITASAVTPQRT